MEDLSDYGIIRFLKVPIIDYQNDDFHNPKIQ